MWSSREYSAQFAFSCCSFNFVRSFASLIFSGVVSDVEAKLKAASIWHERKLKRQLEKSWKLFEIEVVAVVAFLIYFKKLFNYSKLLLSLNMIELMKLWRWALRVLSKALMISIPQQAIDVIKRNGKKSFEKKSFEKKALKKSYEKV